MIWRCNCVIHMDTELTSDGTENILRSEACVPERTESFIDWECKTRAVLIKQVLAK